MYYLLRKQDKHIVFSTNGWFDTGTVTTHCSDMKEARDMWKFYLNMGWKRDHKITQDEIQTLLNGGHS